VSLAIKPEAIFILAFLWVDALSILWALLSVVHSALTLDMW